MKFWRFSTCSLTLLQIGGFFSAFAGASLARAADEIPPPPPEISGAVPTAPEITPAPAGAPLSASFVRKSASGGVLLFQNQGSSSELPPTGQMVLLKNGDTPVMALQVLSVMGDKNQFAAKSVKNYGDDVATGVNYTVVPPGTIAVTPAPISAAPLPAPNIPAPILTNNITSLAPPPPPELAGPSPVPSPSPKVLNDLTPPPPPPIELAPPAPTSSPSPDAFAPPPPPAELAAPAEKTAAPPPPELVAPDPAAKPKKKTSRDTLDESDKQDRSAIEIEEIHQIDITTQMVSVGLGIYQNVDPSLTSIAYYAGVGVRYGFSLGKMIFLTRNKLQDSFFGEVGISYYKIVGLTGTTDGYNVFPMSATVRYNLTYSEDFTLFFDAGVAMSFATGSNADANALPYLTRAIPAIGTGFFVRIGPSWDVRFDLGYDMIGTSLVLKF